VKKLKLKGVSSIKRDKCDFARKLGSTIIARIIECTDMSIQNHCDWLKEELEKIPWVPLADGTALGPFVLSVNLSDTYKSKTTSLAQEVTKLIKDSTGKIVHPNERLPYVVAWFNESKRLHAQCALPPRMFLQEQKVLDVGYYAEKQV